MEIIIKENLEVQPKLLERNKVSKTEFLEKNSDRKGKWDKDYKRQIFSQTLFPVEDTLPEGENVFHKNYLSYLEQCWNAHYGAVLTPDIMWFTLVNEIALIIAEQPEVYRSLFSESEAQQEISVYSDSLTVLPLDSICDELKKYVPSDLAPHFLLNFSTSTERSTLALQAAFADAVSPYYSYSMYCCGIPSVRLEGLLKDWTKIYTSYTTITDKLVSLSNENQKYFVKVSEIITNIIKVINGDLDGKECFSTMFYLEKCGSGGQTEVFGWFTELFRETPKVRFLHNYSTHIAKVKYKHLQTKKNYVMLVGLFYSEVKGEELTPDFGRIVYEKRELVSETVEEKPQVYITPPLEVYEDPAPKKNRRIFYAVDGPALFDNKDILTKTNLEQHLGGLEIGKIEEIPGDEVIVPEQTYNLGNNLYVSGAALIDIINWGKEGEANE